jgi:outer membrane receptor protein involved in Fe transport
MTDYRVKRRTPAVQGIVTMALSAAAIAQETPPETEVETVVVTGTRIQRPDYEANSPTTTVRSEQITGNADVTLDTYLNTLPQVNPAGTTTSNNPPNNGASNIDLRGLGANRNLVLIDGRRPMVSDSLMRVDLNTIPQALVESIEIVTGGAGAVYGADAVAGATNIRLKRNFAGFDLSTSFSNSSEEWDAEEFQVSALLGGNFAEDRGNVALGFDYSSREGMIKSQRPFAAIATQSTSFLPEGLYSPGSNAPTQAAVDAVFASYGVAAGAVPATQTLIGFNDDDSLFSRGVFNNALDAQNFRYPVDLSVNTNFYPDVYSYNFDAVNLLVLPLERRSFFGKFDYELSENVEVFSQIGWTEYSSSSALAPTPIPTVTIRAPGETASGEATSSLVTPGNSVIQQLIVPVTNPFIPADFATLLASRTGDNPALVGAGATEPFLMRQRTLGVGLRESGFENNVVQYLLGARGSLGGESWRWEAHASEGRTTIDNNQDGNIETDRLLGLLAAADGGASQCEGGFDPFGRNPISPDCVTYLGVSATVTTTLRQNIVQAYVSGDAFELPAGKLALVLGAEYRKFKYDLDPGALSGAISGFTTQTIAGGNNEFKDLFLEALIPIVDTVDLSVGYRQSRSQFEDTVKEITSDTSSDDSYKAELSWQPFEPLRLRGSYQRAVRAPNFAELFDGGSSAPQYFDPCSATSDARAGADGASVRQLCIDMGLAGPDTFVQTPGLQLQLVTTGNIALKPESADTFTLGAVFVSPWEGAMSKLRGSIDYYRIDISDPILSPDPNVIIASCYNYYGSNAGYDAGNPDCLQVSRGSGDIAGVGDPNDPNGFFPGINGGKIRTHGLDVQLDYGFELSGAGAIDLNLLFNYLLGFELQERDDLPAHDYVGTVSYFGEGLGTSYPKMRANLNGRWHKGPFSAGVRARWIDAMDNRAAVQFPGESSFTGTKAITYFDFSASWEFMENSQLRLGVNNAFDEKPPLYSPNVQSGTDPSLFDVIGRRVFGQVNFRF